MHENAIGGNVNIDRLSTKELRSLRESFLGALADCNLLPSAQG